MPLVTLKSVIDESRGKGYAIGSFNFNGIEDARGIIEAAEEKNSPVILMASMSAVKYFGGVKPCAAFIRALAEDSPAPIVLHVDHCDDIGMLKDCVDYGFTSVMIDGSALNFEDNVAVTARTVEYARKFGVSVEGELGRLGGREENVDVSDRNANMTDPNAVEEFVARTGVDALAIAIGNAHGFYKGTPKLDVDRLSEIRKVVSIPLVLHGTSGVPDDAVRECIARGMCKVNYATDLRIAFSAGLKEYLAKDPDAFDPKKYNAVGREKVKEYVKSKILVCGSNGKA